MSRSVYIPIDYTNINEQFFRRLTRELSSVGRVIGYNYTCDNPDRKDGRYPYPHFIYAVNEARRRNPRTKYNVRYRLGTDMRSINIKTTTVQTPHIDGLIEIGVPQVYKEITEAILFEVTSKCRHCKNVTKTPHPDYEHLFICDECLLLRNQYLTTVIP